LQLMLHRRTGPPRSACQDGELMVRYRLSQAAQADIVDILARGPHLDPDTSWE
jgi:hypothetical protein